MTPKKIAEFALGPIAGAFLGFISLPIMAWFFTIEDIGRLAMLNVVTGFSTLLFSLGLDQAYVREYHEVTNKPALFKVTLLPGLFLLLIALGVLLCLDNLISYWLFEIDSLQLSLFVAVAILSTFIARFLSLILRMGDRGIAYSMNQMLPKLLLILIVGGYVLFSISSNITTLLSANTAAILSVCLFYSWITRREWLAGFKETINYAYLKSLLNFGVPLIFGGLAFWGLTATDKVLLKQLSSFEQLGLYSIAVSLAAAATIFQSIFTIVWAPIVYKWAAADEGLENINKVNRYVLLVVIILFSLAGLFSWVVTLFLPDDYNAVQWIVIPCLGLPLLYTLSETTVVGVGVTRRTGFAMVAAILAFIVNLTGNYFFIPILGATGAAISTCISFWVFLVLRTEFSIYLWKSLPRIALYTYTSLLVIGSVTNGIYGELYSFHFKIFWGLILISVLVFFKIEINNAFKFFTLKVITKKKD